MRVQQDELENLAIAKICFLCRSYFKIKKKGNAFGISPKCVGTQKIYGCDFFFGFVSKSTEIHMGHA